MRDRQQFVNIRSARSKVVNVPSGIIQGSVFDHFCVIFINDLPDVIRTAEAMLYADDLKLSEAINSIDYSILIIAC